MSIFTQNVSKEALELARLCDISNSQYDEENALKYANAAYQESGLETHREVREVLGANVAYYVFWYGWGGE